MTHPYLAALLIAVVLLATILVWSALARSSQMARRVVFFLPVFWPAALHF